MGTRDFKSNLRDGMLERKYLDSNHNSIPSWLDSTGQATNNFSRKNVLLIIVSTDGVQSFTL